ncbi:hypothetical protein HN695_06560 [Candidatus Woesearchaeota archaeon]|jgi:hypothetical protein|nr:hypothetical protein [Candidatus Woesearchaeota archaeon]MBT5272846.1 hypothetical protein [Candidatus Woesearchaeota archaeon]MBT6040458.1 hypothetical protein [Candidatus Woesearchaeota archaeon]MBT6336465.1 hypothetical protein [Candidatus Woesearchaeota archaeon]MBT7927969.1 hypothetical protein [Candidatus Woesearchaeota archaeon]
MFGKEVVDSKHYYPMLAIVCLVIIGILSWNILVPLLIVLPIALIIPFLITFGRHLKNWKGFVGDWKTRIYAVIYAMTLSIVVFTILSHVSFLIFSGFYNTLLLTSIFLFVSVAVFVYFVIYFIKKLAKTLFLARETVVDMVVVSLIVCLIWSGIFLALVGSGIYNNYVVKSDNYISSVADSMQEYQLSDEKGMIVFDELDSYYKLIFDDVNEGIKEIKEKEASKNLVFSCLLDDCFDFAFSRMAVSSIFSMKSSDYRYAMQNAREANAELKENEEFGNVFGDTNIKNKKEYYDYLKQIMNGEYYIQDLDDYDSLFVELEEDFDYKKLMEIDAELKKFTPNSAFVSLLDEFKSNSLLINGVGKVLMHTHFAEHGFKAITKMSLTGHRINMIRSTFELLYLNKDKEESADSKIVRYYVLSKGGNDEVK